MENTTKINPNMERGQNILHTKIKLQNFVNEGVTCMQFLTYKVCEVSVTKTVQY